MNLNQTQQRIRWVTFAILAGVTVLLTVLDSTGTLDTAVNFLRDPMAVIVNWTAVRADPLTDALAGPRDLQAARAEIVRLQEQNELLERENEQLREIQGEYQLLLDLFNRARQAPEFRRLTASVIGRDTSPALRSIIIDKGTADGVLVGMPVESSRGLVGRVFRTTAHASQIVLVTDNASRIAARLGSSRATGMLQGGGLGGSMSIDWIDLKYQIGVNEIVMTSGLGGQFPPDVVVGRVVEVERREAELFQRAIVQPAVDFNSLEMVFVITDFRPVDIDVFSSPLDN